MKPKRPLFDDGRTTAEPGSGKCRTCGAECNVHWVRCAPCNKRFLAWLHRTPPPAVYVPEVDGMQREEHQGFVFPSIAAFRVGMAAR